MLTPQYLDELPRKLVGITAELEEDIAKDIARRIVKADYLTPTAKWQVYKAKQLRSSNGEIAQQIARYSGKTRKEIAKLFRGACFDALGPETEVYRRAGLDPPQFYRSETFDKLVKAGIKNNKGLMKNLTKTTAKTADRAFERLLDKAYFQNLSGAWSHQEIIAKTVRELAAKGVQQIAYPSGHGDKADVAVRRALLTSVNQTSMQLSLAYADEMGCDLVETTAHGGARPDHARWQGQIFSRSGKSKKYPDFRRSTGYGTGTGLGGWNCRHSIVAYIEGSGRAYSEEYLKKLEEKTVSYNGKDYTEYEARQLQRSFERRIRDTKRQAGVLDTAIKTSGDKTLREELQQEFERVSVKLKSREAALKDFLSQTGRLQDTSREQAVGFGRSTAQKTVAANKYGYRERLRKRGMNISQKEVAKHVDLRYTNPPEYELQQKYLRSVNSGMLSPLAEYDNYRTHYKRIQEELVGQKTSNGITIQGQADHFLERVLGTTKDPKTGRPRSGVAFKDIREALLYGRPKPIKYTNGKPSQLFVTDKCAVAINPETGVLIQCNP